MSKLQRANEKIAVLKNYPNVFNINLYKYLSKPKQYEKLKNKGCTTFGDIAKLNSADELHIKSSTMINHALIKLFSEKHIPYLKKHFKTAKQNIKPKSFSIYRLLNGHATAKKFTMKEFRSIFNPADVKKIKTDLPVKLTRKEKITVYCSSREERILIKKMDHHRDFKLLRTQFPKIPNGKEGYHPDIFMLTRTNRIAIIEVKKQFNMSEKDSQSNYRLLKNYCIKHGYLYMMCDKKFNEYETYQNLFIPTSISNAIDFAIKDHDAFDYNDYIKLLPNPESKKYHKRKNKIENYIARYVKRKKLKQSGRWSKKMKIRY